MRSLAEIRFRLAQEAANAWLLAVPPCFSDEELNAVSPLDALPDPGLIVQRLKGSAFAREVESLAEQVLAHRYPLLGTTVEAPPPVDWRRDYLSGRTSGLEYFRRIPYLEADRVGDHKIIWELNRHQHLVLLAQAFRLTGRRELLARIQSDLESWWLANPFHRGINWASALEVAFRVLSWIWVWHLAGPEFSESFRRRFLAELFRHGAHLERNLSFYFSPNTHLLGEAVALHALGALFPACRFARRWKKLGRSVTLGEMERQVRADGSHFEQSSYYHVYALDLFLFHSLLEAPPESYREKLVRMGRYLDALLGPGRVLPLIGDDDGGRLFHPYGPPERRGRDTLAAAALLLGHSDWSWEPDDVWPQAAWWLGPVAIETTPPPSRVLSSQIFSDSGMTSLCSSQLQVIVDAGGFGPGGAGHSHSDALSVLARTPDEELLVDSGTYTYVAEPAWRDRFRGSSAHNTCRVDGLDQAVPVHAFRWEERPEVVLREWTSGAGRDYIDAECRFRGFRHRRRVLLLKPDMVVILDEVDGPDGEHMVEQFWHAGAEVTPLSSSAYRLGRSAVLYLPESGAPTVGEYWQSRVFGEKQPAAVITAMRKGPFPCRMAAALSLRGELDRVMEKMLLDHLSGKAEGV